MKNALMTKRKAEAVSNGVFLVLIGMMIYATAFWPWILLALWAWIGLRQLLTARKYDFIVSTILFLGLFIISFFDLKWAYIMPVLFILGGIYIVFREYFYSKDTNGEDIADEIEDDTE